ncbi:proteasome alpha subunit [Echinococcus multilocularis]|uniref:Proteasome alpha subunit n=1 Tax=Echinococcus multilocularis TaxID=6211 RepID=A0A068Y8D2_ECHMU|nr:proteasome alpha subunit [Echinococcus multilocularis]
MNDGEMGGAATLDRLLQEIARQRSKTIGKDFILNSGTGYGPCDQSSGPSKDMFWAALFWSTFCKPGVLHLIDSGSHDDLLFIPYLRVFRLCSPNIPQLNDRTVNWENTVYLNLITHCFTYVITLGICTRSGAQEMEILKKKSLIVYASPSYRPMFSKGTQETIVYPHIVFSIDNFEDKLSSQAFQDCDLRDSECLCLELTAYDRSGALQGVLFEGVVRYAVLKSAYDIDVYSRGCWRFAPARAGPETVGGADGVSYAILRTSVWMLARRGEGIAEVTIQQEVENSALLSESATISNSSFSHLRRLSIPCNVPSEAGENICLEKVDSRWDLMRRRSNAAYRSTTSSPLHTSVYHLEQRDCPSVGNLVPHCSSAMGEVGGTGTSQIHRLVVGESGKSRQRPFAKISPFGQYRKAMSDDHNLNCSLKRFRPTKKCIEINSSTFEDEFDDQPLTTVPSTENEMDASVEKQATFGQAWQWFKERRRITSAPIRAGVTYVSLPWHLIISGIFDAKKTPVLTSTFMESWVKMGPFHESAM